MPRLITFGGLSVDNDTVVNGLANPRSRLAILAVLATSGDRGIRREKLAALFWPESDEERARTALRQALFTLKKDLAAGEIVLGGVDLRLNPEVITSDVSDFSAAIADGRVEDAAESYRGPFLDGVYVRESPGFERWVEEQRERLATEYRRAVDTAATQAKARGDQTTAVRWWERLAVHDPLSGRVARAYMEALADAGERERAIRYAETHARLVRQELEAEPDSEVLMLALRLRSATVRNGDVVRSAAPDTVAATLPDGDATATPTTADRRRLTGRPAIWIGLAAAAAAAGIVLASTLRSDGPPIQRGLIAVGFIENRTGDSTVATVLDAAATDIARLLSESQRATVLDLRASVPEGAATSPAALRRVAAELARRSNAEYLVQGHASWRGDSVVLVGQVLEARSGRIAHQLDPIVVHRGMPEGVLDHLREGIGGAVMALTDTIFRSAWGGPRPPKYSAYLEFMRAADALIQRYEPNAATPYLLKAMTLDPESVQPKLLFLQSAVGPTQQERIDSVRKILEAQHPRMSAYDKAATDRQLAMMDLRYQDAFTAARQMVSLAPQSADARGLLAHASMATKRYRRAIEALHTLRASPGWVKDMNNRRFMDYQAHRLLGDFETGIEEFRRDVAEAVNDPGICQFGFPLLAAAGDERAVDSLLLSCTGVRSSPLLQAGQLQIAGRNYRMSGHREAAERAFRRTLAMRIEQTVEDATRWPGVVGAHADLGEWRQVYNILKSKKTLDPVQRVMLGTSAGYTGDTATALETLRWLQPQTRPFAHAERAFILIGLGRVDEAIRSLTAAIESGVVPGWTQWYIRPELHAIRADYRFEALIRPVRP